MDSSKDNGLNSILNNSIDEGHNYHPKIKHHKGKNRMSKLSKKVVHKESRHHQLQNKVKSKPSYSNIRTSTSVVDKLKAYQIIDGERSRSDLLDKMIKMCKPKILDSVSKKEAYKKTLHSISVIRNLKNNK